MTGTPHLLCNEQRNDRPKARLWAGSSMCIVLHGTKNSLMASTVGLSRDEKTRVMAKEATDFTGTTNWGSPLKSQDWGLGKCELKKWRHRECWHLAHQSPGPTLQNSLEHHHHINKMAKEGSRYQNLKSRCWVKTTDSPSFLFSLNDVSLLWACVYDVGEGLQASAPVWRSRDHVAVSMFCFHLYLVSGDWTQVAIVNRQAPLPSEPSCGLGLDTLFSPRGSLKTIKTVTNSVSK